MGRLRKPDEVKFCEYCGKQLHRKRQANGDLESNIGFHRRKYCDTTCMRLAYKGRYRKASSEVGWYEAHRRARNLVLHGRCEKCGTENATDVHHIDQNPRNNDYSNLIRLCRSCHMKIHRKRGSCVICGEPMKGHGYCNKHLLRFKKYGNPFWVNGHDEREVMKE